MKSHNYSILYIVLILLSFTGSSLAQTPLTDRIVIEFMKPGDKDAEARKYNLLPWPEEAKAAAYKAAEIWASYLEITVPIRVKFGWCDNLDADARGGATYSYQYTDGYYYPLPLINQLLDYDKNKDVVDIVCVFKSNIKVGWYFGTDGEIGLTPAPDIPGAQYFQRDFMSIALHEICHGLGINNTFFLENGLGKWGGSVSGKANIYDTFLYDNKGDQLIDENIFINGSKELAIAITSGEIYWYGRNAIKANDNKIIRLHSPKQWYSSSLLHLGEEFANTQNGLMSFNGLSGGTHQHTPGSIVLGMLQDMGWKLKESSTETEVVSLTKTKVSAYNGIVSIIDAKMGESVRIYEISGKMVYNGKVSSDRIEVSISGHGIYIVQVGGEGFKVVI